LYETSFDFSKKEMVAMGLAAGMAVVAFASENEMLEFVQKHDGKIADNLQPVGEFYGSRNMALGLAGTYVLGVVLGEDKIRKTSVIAIEAMIFNVLINDSLKKTFRRALPRETSDPFAITESEDAPDMGMPSGHTTTAFAVATVIADQYGKDSMLIPVIAYGLAGITAWSRVYDNSHWASDVFIGAIVGHVTGRIVSSMNGKTGSKYNFAATPYFDRHGGGGVIVSIKGKTPQKRCKERDWECFGRTINGQN
jgi:membrane-associated phospholipid phosphatase